MMRTQHAAGVDRSRQWFLDTPEAQVMGAARERELLLELAECRRGLLRVVRRPDGSEWGQSRPDAAFRQAVRNLAEGRGGDGPAATESARRLARRHEEIRGALAMANARLVAYIARRYLNRGPSPSDLLQEGFCGLLEAIDRFDPVNTTRLATYASWWIRQAIQRAIADGSYPVRLTPRQLRRLARSLPKGRSEDPGVEPAATWHELAAIRPRLSLDAVSRYDDATPMADLLAAVPDTDPDEEEREESVAALLASLAPREQLVIKLRYGLDGHPRHSLSQIGEILSVSKERVRQIQDRALRRLRDAAGFDRALPISADSIRLEG